MNLHLGLMFAVMAAAVPYASAHAESCSDSATVYFDQNSAVPSEAELAKALRLVQSAGFRRHVTLYLASGNADRSEGREAALRQLSLARAGFVLSRVLKAYPDLQGLVDLEGRGSISSTSIEPAANRRVEIEVLCR